MWAGARGTTFMKEATTHDSKRLVLMSYGQFRMMHCAKDFVKWIRFDSVIRIVNVDSDGIMRIISGHWLERR